MAEDKESRIGFLIDGDPGTDLMSALYEFDETGVRLHVPFRTYEDARSRWWAQALFPANVDPGRSNHRDEPPPELNFVDSKGSVGLLGCSAGAYTAEMIVGVGRGTIRARYAVEGAYDAGSFLKLNGLRSEVDGLSHWLAYSTHETRIKVPEGGGPVEITTTMRPVDAVRLGRPLNLRAIAIGTGPGGWSPEAAYRSRVFVETFTKVPNSWQGHIALHSAIRNLVRIAAWRPINFQSHQASSLKDSAIGADGQHRQWREVRTATTGIAAGVWKRNDRFLFYFSDLGSRGISRWLKLSTAYERGLLPFVDLLDLEGVTIDAAMSQLGIAVEALGYQALIDSGLTPEAANRIPVARRVDHLLGEVADTLSFTSATFGQDFADSYNSVKHANRSPVPPDVKFTHFRNGVELIRTWVALRLGVSSETLRTRR